MMRAIAPTKISVSSALRRRPRASQIPRAVPSNRWCEDLRPNAIERLIWGVAGIPSTGFCIRESKLLCLLDNCRVLSLPGAEFDVVDLITDRNNGRGARCMADLELSQKALSVRLDLSSDIEAKLLTENILEQASATILKTKNEGVSS